MKTVHEHLVSVNDRNKRILENQKQYYWRNLPADKKKRILKINFASCILLLLFCLYRTVKCTDR